MGVGAAIARAGRDRRAKQQRVREREFRLQPGEPLAEGLRRIAIGQVDLAIELIEGDGTGALGENAVHETRKALKRLRALVRLLREELGESAFQRENGALRDAGRCLAGARDAEVVLATLDALIERHPRRLRRRGGVARLRGSLLDQRERMAGGTISPAAQAEVLLQLRAFRLRAQHWRLMERRGLGLVEPGLERIYRQGRRRHARVLSGRGSRSRAMHEWRKRVKDLRYAAEMLQRRGSSQGDRRVGARKRKRARAQETYLRKLAKRADELGELLGEEHDLVLLEELVRSCPGSDRGASGAGTQIPPVALSRRTRKLLLRLVKRRRRELRIRALQDGERLYAPTPTRFVRRVRRAYASGAR